MVARSEGQLSADAARLVTLEVLPKVNVEVVGEDRADLPLPREGETGEAYFDIQATCTGTCKVWVVVRQGPLPLLTLHLEAAAIDAQPARPPARHPARASASLGSPAPTATTASSRTTRLRSAANLSALSSWLPATPPGRPSTLW